MTRRLFLVLDLSLLRQPEDQRQAALAALTTAIGRLWAAYQGGGDGASCGGHVSWGYALYDSACAELLLKPKLRRTAQTLRKSGGGNIVMGGGTGGSLCASGGERLSAPAGDHSWRQLLRACAPA